MNNLYAKAYSEVLEVLRHLPKEEYEKIPKEEIEFYKNNCDKQYEFIINPAIPIEEQNISTKANAVLVNIFMNYFATETQKAQLNNILKSNSYKANELKKEKYSENNIFEKRAEKKVPREENVEVVPYKESIFKKILTKIQNIFKSLKK